MITHMRSAEHWGIPVPGRDGVKMPELNLQQQSLFWPHPCGVEASAESPARAARLWFGQTPACFQVLA